MENSAEIFGSLVLNQATMKKHLPRRTFNALQNVIDKGSKLSDADADTVAQTMMEWALSKGATHYTHWFQPMTGLTAQKHDAFFSFDSALNPIERFSGSQLIQGEPDASSFPSGGMRSTFEARGYTAWDPSSPAFVMNSGDIPVFCIPSVFFSYTGHALDKKTPLLRSIKILNKEASRAIKLLSGRTEMVEATIGIEQEYFLVDRDYFRKRPDLIMAGRTVIGSRPAKGQQMEDHYFGSIKDRVLAFMHDLEQRLYRLGVPCKTRHNEVAPNQFEMAPIFETANLAADHNQIAMELIRKTAHDHGMAALLHEKPFADVNGSGKHLNWSMKTKSGNLLEPGKNPHENLEFLYFLVATIGALSKRGDVLRSTVASAGNDHRLGANEAPPAIMSVFLGSHLSQILDKIEAAEDPKGPLVQTINLGLAELPEIMQDTTDRNRTSPFAFTGNKFEFRAVGSGQSISVPAAILNVAVTESLAEMNDQLEKIENRADEDLIRLLREFIKKNKSIRFEGNNYSDKWAEEAKKRGLSNLKTTPEAYEVWERKEVREFLASTGILSEQELEARWSIRLEEYSKRIGIEATVLLRLIDNFVLPPSIRYQTEVATAIKTIKEVHSTSPVLIKTVEKQITLLERLGKHIGALIEGRDKLENLIEEVENLDDLKREANACSIDVLPFMSQLRDHCDALESIVDAKSWSLPTYHELLFLM